MIDMGRCHSYVLQEGVDLKMITCPRCGHRMGMEDILSSPKECTFCGKFLRIDDTWYDEVEIEEPNLGVILEET